MNPLVATQDVQPTANFLYGVRIVAPVTGHMRDLTLMQRLVGSNVRVFVYDTGQATLGVRTLLYSSGLVAVAAVGGANPQQIVGDPNLAVVAGSAYDIGLQVDATVAKFLGMGGPAGRGALPGAYLPVAGGVAPKLSWVFNPGSLTVPATVTEAQADAVDLGLAFFIAARFDPS